MTRHRKSLEEQLAEIQAKQERMKARLAALELRRKARDRRLRSHGERVLLRLMLQRMEEDSAFKEVTRRYIKKAELRPQEREAIVWLIEAGEDSADSPVPALPSGSGEAG